MSSERKRKTLVGPRQMRRRVKDAVDNILRQDALNVDELPCVDSSKLPSPEGSLNPCQVNDSSNDNIHNNSKLLGETSTIPEINIGEQTNFSENHADDDEQILMEVESFDFYNDCTGSERMLNCSTDDENNVEVPELLPGFDWSVYEEIDHSEQVKAGDSFVVHAKESLAEWVLKSNIPRIHVTSLLKCLNDDLNLTYLPLDWRTLLKAKRGKVVTSSVPPGEYHHLGVISALYGVLQRMEAVEHVIPDVLKLLFNVDGIPISNSSMSEFWPILFKVLDWNDVLVAGIYHGKKKPADKNMYLMAFRDDICQLTQSGIEFGGKNIRISVCGMSSDSPATTFVLNIATHNAYHGCRKCTTKGSWVSNSLRNSAQAKSGGRVTFPELQAPLRTDSSFRGRFQPEHHKDNGRSIIEDILVDVVGDVVLDYLHLVCIGVYKKMLTDWISGKLDSARLKKEAIFEISTFRVAIRNYVPSDFARKTRPLDEMPRWKATEHRLDLLYICPVAYKKHLPQNKYNHLMILHVAIKLLVNPNSCKEDASYADKLLREFVRASSKFYGDSFVTFNLHSLIHLANDVLRHGCLDDFSAFPFENKLQIIKNLLRKSGRPLQQIVRRLMEIDQKNIVSSSMKVPQGNTVKVSLPHANGPVVPEHNLTDQFHKLNWKNVMITTSKPDNCIFVEGNRVVIVKNILECRDGEILIIGKPFDNYEDQFVYPVPSSMLNEFLVSKLSNVLQAYPLSAIKTKAFCFPISISETDHFFVSPLINHTVM